MQTICSYEIEAVEPCQVSGGGISRGVEYEDQIAERCIYSDSVVKQTIIKLLYLYLYDCMLEKNIEGYVLREGTERRKRRDN